MTDAIDVRRSDQRTRPPSDEPITAVGRWYHVKTEGEEWLGCVTRVGSNYAKLVGPSTGHYDSTHSWRIHLDNFDACCTPVADIDAVIAHHVDQHRTAAAALMEEVKAITARLGLANTTALTPDTQGLVVASGKQPIADYKAALVLAQKETLPELFKRIENENKMMASWMKAALIPLQAEVGLMKRTIGGIEERVFHVELYAGLIETVVQIAEGAPAGREERIRLMQRRCYMDEECLAAYDEGGMDIAGLNEFDRWLAQPVNRDRILPFPRCVVAFQVRRKMKERPWTTLAQLLDKISYERADKSTFLYIRNGDQLYRLETGIDFEEQLFPDLDRQTYAGKLWAETEFGHVKEVISDAQYKGIRDADKAQRAKIKAMPNEDRWRVGRSDGHEADRYTPVNPSNVFFDDANAVIAAEMKKHNRLVLILQGLLDRSPALHPHPVWQLWTDAGFTAALELIFDDSRALVPGAAPDFEAYRAEANATLKTGSMTIGQEAVWRAREAAKGDRYLNSYRRYGDPGPERLGCVAQFIPRSRTCVYNWERSRSSPKRWMSDPDHYPVSMRVPAALVFNVDAYKLGDIKRFFVDPRTRADYLQWAPLLVECEKYHGAKKGKP